MTLSRARRNRRDEFYTQLPDIEAELRHYKHHFRDKVVFCNCDDPQYSNFWKFFSLNFEHLGLKKLIATHYDETKPTYKLELVKNGSGEQEVVKTPLRENGDFRSREAVELLKEADIVVTNPPFSLFREYIAQLMEYEKNFVIIGSKNAVSYKEVAPLFREGKIWLGYGFRNGNAFFKIPEEYGDEWSPGVYDPNTGLVKFRNVSWFTNLDVPKRHQVITLYKRYSPEEYPSFDHYDAINVDRVAEIPYDYDGAMGVPITFLDRHNPDQFEILDANDYRRSEDVPYKEHGLIKDKEAAINGRPKYVRLLIRRRKGTHED